MCANLQSIYRFEVKTSSNILFVMCCAVGACSFQTAPPQQADIARPQSTSSYVSDYKAIDAARATLPARAYKDTLRAIIAFVRFQDDTYNADVQTFNRGWPLRTASREIPDFGHHLLSSTESPPFDAYTLTDYFYHQSLGNLIIYGDAFPRVIVSKKPESEYHRPNGGYGNLAIEVLERLDLALDLSDYDRNGDGKLDHLFLFVRGDSQRDAKRFVWTGISCLDARCGGRLTAGKRLDAGLYDGVAINWGTSGSIIMNRTPGNVDAHSYAIRMMAHEFGHDLWAPYFTHIQSLRNNDVPLTSNRAPGRNAERSGTASLGYVLMAGAGGGPDTRGDETISAFERDLLGWINCRELKTNAFSLQLGDLYTTSECYKIPFEQSGQNRRLYLTNRQRVGYFDQYRRGGRDRQFEVGFLRTTGLLVHLAVSNRLDFIPADNSADLSIHNADYDGDLFGPETKNQLTPWTRPSIDGFNRRPRTTQPFWGGVDNIRYVGESGSRLEFDFYADMREHPTIRADSWFGQELEGFRFQAQIAVVNGATLSVGSNIIAGGGISIMPGSTVRVERDYTVTIPAGESIVVDNATLVIRGDVQGTVTTRNGGRVER